MELKEVVKSLKEEELSFFLNANKGGRHLFFHKKSNGIEESFFTWNTFKLGRKSINLDLIQLDQRQQIWFSSNTLN